jgi:hypothetical protein
VSSIKTELVAQLRKILEAELDVLLKSAAAARDAATHAEAKPENKYDTRGLEASYLAGAQAERAAELQRDLQVLASLPLRTFGSDDKVAATALVAVERNGQPVHYFVMPVGGGARLTSPLGPVTVITPQSPLGRALQDPTSDLEISSIC